MKLPVWLIPDLVLAAVILLMLLDGHRKGIILMCGKIVALICAVFGASYAKQAFAESLAQTYIVPYVAKLLGEAKDRLGLSDGWDTLGSILHEVSLPEFLRIDVFEKALEKGGNALNAATEVIAQRLSEWLLVLITAIILYRLILLLVKRVLHPLVQAVPIVGDIDSALGTILGFAFGIVVAGFLLRFCYGIFPALSKNSNNLLSPDSIENSYIVKTYIRYFPEVFRF